MDKSWMYKKKWTQDYALGVKNFIEFASSAVNSVNKILCPCTICINREYLSLGDTEMHIMRNGFFTGYQIWSRHGEEHDDISVPRREEVTPTQDDENMMGELLRDVFEVRNESTVPASENTEPIPREGRDDDKITKLIEDATTELYPGCKVYSKLSFLLELYRLKCLNSWTETSFDMLLELLLSAFPDGTHLPKSIYEVKKILKAFNIGYEKIHACPNNCMLYWGDEAQKEKCNNCDTSRWDPKKQANLKPAKILRYFPLIPRLQRLYQNKKSAKRMLWHQNGRTKDGLIRHPADGEAWKSFDVQFPDFAADPRNIRLGLASDGFNPFQMSVIYSIWPVILVPYNLAPWIGMKHDSFILSTLIPGDKCPGNDIDVYLKPLIKELQELWHGVRTYDAVTGEYFVMRAALLWTINDFPAYAMLSGWSTKGRYACPCCAEKTDSLWLKNSKKFSYMGHRKWLSHDHRYRSQKVQFNNSVDFRSPPSRSTGTQIVQKLQNQKFTYGIDVRTKAEKRKRKDKSAETIWKKKSIFFDLPYWESNKLRHNLDVMHIEKNVSDNVIHTLLGLDNSKDNLNARLDLISLNIRSELHPQKTDSDVYLIPPSASTMSKTQIQMLCQVLKNMRLPKNYASNISRCVSVNEGKISGLKTHDHHVLIEDILPVALVPYAPSHEVMTIISNLGRFLKSICATVIDPAELDKLQETIAITLCEIEKYFMPSFLTMMVHLLVHLVEEIKLGGPVQYRWMYPFERFFSVLKKYVRNKAQPEGSIAEVYIADEAILFCSKYLKVKDNTEIDEKSVDYKFGTKGSALGKITRFQLDEKELIQIQRYVLRHCDIIEPMRQQFIAVEKRKKGLKHLTTTDIDKLLDESFHDWLKKMVLNNVDNSENDEIKTLASGPSRRARSFRRYCTNGYNYHTVDIDKRRKTQNHGVINKTEVGEFSYLGRIVQMIDVNYSDTFHIVLFKCEWANTTSTGMRTDQYGNKMVNFTRLIHTGDKLEHDPYVFSSQVDPIFFIDDPKNTAWKYVIKGKPRDVFNFVSIIFTFFYICKIGVKRCYKVVWM